MLPLVLASLSSTFAQGACLLYQSEVTIAGALTKRTFPEQPNYESIAGGDAAATYFFVSPPSPICVRAGNVEGNELAESSVPSVQLVFDSETAPAEYKRLRPLLGKSVACSGTLLHAISGHHHSPVLLLKSKCHSK